MLAKCGYLQEQVIITNVFFSTFNLRVIKKKGYIFLKRVEKKGLHFTAVKLHEREIFLLAEEA